MKNISKLRAKWPAVIVELAQLPSIGVQKARKLHEALAPTDLDAVAAEVTAVRPLLLRERRGREGFPKRIVVHRALEDSTTRERSPVEAFRRALR